MPFNLSIIREATAADAPAIAYLHAESWRSAYRGILTDYYLDNRAHEERLAVWQERFAAADAKQLMYVMVAEGGDSLVGFVCLFPEQDQTWGSFLDNLHVMPGLTGRGIGRQLLSEAGRYLMTRAPHCGVCLWVIEQNYGARRFYERAGASIVGSRSNQMPDGQSVVADRCQWCSPDLLLANDGAAGLQTT